MTYFNKKEEVMQVELTPYGRYLLSIGKLMPHHYKFFDDNIVYDVTSFGPASGGGTIVEKQNHSHVRIMENTPQIKTNPNVSGVSNSIMLLELQNVDPVTTPNLPNRRIVQKDDNINFLQQELGTNSYESNNSPSFQVDLFNGEISGSSKLLSSQNTQNMNIPQIDIDFGYEYLAQKKTTPITAQFTPDQEEEFQNQDDFDIPYYTKNFDDETYFKIIPKVPLVRIRENNSFDEKENFEIKAFIVERDSTTQSEVYTPFQMQPQTMNIINELLVGEGVDDNPIFASAEHNDPRFLEYYLNIQYDREIPDIEICKAVGSLEIKNIFLDEYVDCEDLLDRLAEDDIDFDIYASRVTTDDLEDCD